jgi:Flp pilus assembly pilin Flp
MWPVNPSAAACGALPIEFKDALPLPHIREQGRGSPLRGTWPVAPQGDVQAVGPHSELPKGVKRIVSFTDLATYFRARFGVEEGQTMAEYGVVLAVITALVVVAILALSGAIADALAKVQSYL